MILSDLNPEVTAFFEVEHLGPHDPYVRYGTRYLTSNRAIWSICDINASHIFVSTAKLLVCFTVGLVKNTFSTTSTLLIPIDLDSSAGTDFSLFIVGIRHFSVFQIPTSVSVSVFKYRISVWYFRYTDP